MNISNFNDIINSTPCGIKTAIFDFDGTISTLRCGWEAVMEKVALQQLVDANISESELKKLIGDYIDESTGIQTIYQMEWLAQQVEVHCNKKPLDPWEYKEIYNDELLVTVNERIKEIKKNPACASKYLIPGAVDFLNTLKEKGVEIFIASGTDDADVKNEADLLGISKYAVSIKGAPHRQKSCSKEFVIKEILKSGNISAGELMVAGDGKVEIAIGKEAGAVCVGVASNEVKLDGSVNRQKEEKLKKAGADLIVADFSDLSD